MMKLSNNSGLPLLLLSLISMTLLLSPSARGDVSVVFSSAMIGFIGQNTQEVCDPDTQPNCDVGMMTADDDDGGLVPVGTTNYASYQPRLSSAVGITYFAFTQETTLSKFANATTLGYNYTNQGNDVPGYLSIFYTDANGNAAVKSVKGAVAWNDKSGSTVDAIGFLIGSEIPNFSIVTNKGTVNFYGDMDGKNDCCEGGDSNIALITNNSSKTYVDKEGFKGSADTKFLDALNDYLEDPSSQPDLTTTKTVYEVNGSTTIPNSVQSGDVLRYKIVLSNSGLITVTSELTEAVPSGTLYTGIGEGWPTDTFKRIVSINPSSSVELFFTVTVSASLSGISSITNTVSASLGTCSSCTVSTPVQTPSLKLVKTASALGASPSLGDVVTYTYLITNTGDVTLSNVGITADTLQTLASTPRSQLLADFDGDANTTMDVGDVYFLSGSTPSGACANKTLAAGASINCAATYLLTQAAFDDGGISNQATATGSSPGKTNDVTDVSDDADDTDGNTAEDPTESPITALPKLKLIKTASDPSDPDSNGVDEGDTITYTYTATNAGNVTLTNAAITENSSDFTGTGTLPSPAYSSGGSDQDSDTAKDDLAVGESVVWTAVYVLTQADVDAGFIENQAKATGSSPGKSDDVTDLSDDDGTNDSDKTKKTYFPVANQTLDKSITSKTGTAGAYAVGDVVTYTITQTNTGNVTLNNVVITDDKVTKSTTSGKTGSCASVAPSATCVLEGTYTITQTEKDAGTFKNTASVKSTEIPTALEASNTITLAANAKPTLSKTLTSNVDEDKTSTITVGDTLTYTVTLLNDGDVTITDTTITDDKVSPSSASCSSVVVNGTCVLTGTYKVTQADVDAGKVVNNAASTSKNPGGDTLTREASNTETITQSAAQTLAKVVSSKTGTAGAYAVGDVVTYTITQTNTGNVTLNNVVITDDEGHGKSTTSGETGSCTSVAPSATCILVGTYTITQTEKDAGTFKNTASVKSTEIPTALEDSNTITLAQSAAQTLAKAVTSKTGTAGAYAVGDVVTYTITQTNTGNVTLNNVVITDDKVTKSTTSGKTGSCASVAPSATCVLEGTYTITQTEKDAGTFKNTASVKSTEIPTALESF